MKILFTANRFPYPPYRGDKLKIYHLARRLSQHHELQLITFLQDKSDQQYLSKLQPYFSKIHLIPLPKTQSIFSAVSAIFSRKPFQVAYFHSSEMNKAIRNLHDTEHFDVVHVQHLRMAQYWAKYTDVPRILDLPDAYSLYWKRRRQSFHGPKKWFAKWEQKRVFNYENILKQYDLSLVCSIEDQKYLQQNHQLKNVALLPNGVDTDVFSDERHDYDLDKAILFTGNMDYAPNVDAVVYFSEDILPKIQKKIPDVKFIIAGQRPVKKVLALASKNIMVTGFVKNLNDVYRQASIVVAPLRFGAGTQNKVLEAMAMGVAVVSGRVGFHGLNIHSGEGVLLAENSSEFSKLCIRLLSDKELRKQTGLSGKEVINHRFSWDIIAPQLEQYFHQAVSEHLKNTP